jgi:hypothetical protein
VDDPTQLAHPRYYNIAWMTLLDEITSEHNDFASVWETARR